MDQPKTILGRHFHPKAQGPLLPIKAHVVEHHIGQPPQLGCNEHGLPPGDPLLLQLRQLGDNTDAPDATDDTTALDIAEAWLEVRNFKQENLLAELGGIQ